MKTKEDLILVGLEEWMVEGEDYKVLTDTPFDLTVVKHVYFIQNHEVDKELAVTLGLGVIENEDGERFLYNTDFSRTKERVQNEILRMGVYYQITHPNYDDKQLEKTIINTVGGKEYLKLVQTNDSDYPYERLKEIFDSKKGNVVSIDMFRK